MQLSDLAERSLVQIRLGTGEYSGVGFVIAPEVVVTNAHVAADDGVTVWAGGESYAGTVVTRLPPEEPADGEWGLPDLAEIAVPGLAVPPVLLGPATAAGPVEMLMPTFDLDTVISAPDGAETRTKFLQVGAVGNLWALRENTVVSGLSGSPVLDRDTGRVCGMLKASAWFTAPEGLPVPTGGWMIPLSRHAPASWFERNAAANPYGNQWRRLAAGADKVQAALFEPDDPLDEITPADLLDPESDYAPFERVPEYDELLSWCTSETTTAVRVVHGTSGAGKNRIAVELCRTLRGRGWVAGFAREGNPERWQTAFEAALRSELQVGIVVDDAEHRREHISSILRQMWSLLDELKHDGVRPTVRVMVLTRTDPSRFETAETFETEFLLVEVVTDRMARWIGSVLDDPVMLPEVLRDGRSVRSRAFSSYAERLGIPRAVEPVWPDDLPMNTTLDLYAVAADAALSIRFDRAWQVGRGRDPLRAIRDHQLRFWAQKLKQTGYSLRRPGSAPPRRPSVGSQSVEIPLSTAEAWLLVPTLAAAESERHLRRVMDLVATALDAPGAGTPATIYELYPAQPRTGLPAVLGPDRLAELMFREVCKSLGEVRLREYLAGVLWLTDGTRPPDEPDRDRYAHPALRLIGRARGASEITAPDDEAYGKIDNALQALLTAYPKDLFPALTKVCGELPNAASLVRLLVIAADNSALDVLPLVVPDLPDDGRGLSPLAVRVYGRLIGATTGMADESLASRVAWNRSLSLHHEHLGRHDDALRTNQDAITECRVLRSRGERWPEMFARLHADRALFLLRRNEINDAMVNGAVAIQEYRELGPSHALALADVLHNQDILYAKADRLHQALEAGEEALRLYGEDSGPRRSRAAARLQVSEDLADLGRIPEALEASTAGVAILRDLFAEAPSSYAADLMRALAQHAMVLQDAGDGLRIGKLPGAEEHLARARDALETALSVSRSLPADEPELLGLVNSVRRVLDEG